MAHLNSIVEITRIRKSTTEFKTKKKTWPSGRETARKLWATPRETIEVEWDGINDTEYALIKQHFIDNFGGYGIFTVTDTHTGVTYNVRYKDDKMPRKSVKKNVSKLYKLKMKLVEVKS